MSCLTGGGHVWYSDLAHSPRVPVCDWCVICGDPRPMTPAPEETPRVPASR